MLIDVLHLLHQAHGVVGQGPDVGAPGLVVSGVVKARGCHVSAANGLDFLQLTKPVLTDYLRRPEKANQFNKIIQEVNRGNKFIIMS